MRSEALTRITDIAPLLNPLINASQKDHLSLTPTRNARKQTKEEHQDKILFDPEISCKTNLAECFRVFTDPNRISRTPARRQHIPGFNLPDQTITVYTDGACFNNGKENAYCGSRIWVSPNNELNKKIRVPGQTQSNQVGELAAVMKTATMIPASWPLIIMTDSKYVIQGLTKHLRDWENKGWIGIKNANLFKTAAYLLRRRTAPTLFKWVKGHAGDQGNEESDRLAKEGAEKTTQDDLPLEVPIEYDLQGAKLATMTQALAYKGIKARKTPTERPTTRRNLELIKLAIRDFALTQETTRAIWKGLRKKSIRARVQQFLYKTIHGTYKIGTFWSNIPGYEPRGQRPLCRTTETMDHILTTCSTAPVNTIWTLAQEMWPHAPELWPDISISTIMGCGSLTNPEEEEHSQHEDEDESESIRRKLTKKGMERLRQILISEAAHLIWVLRCEQVINEQSHTPSEIESRWYKAINARLTEDKIQATKIKRAKTSVKLVIYTWETALWKRTPIPRDWVHTREVLVGRRVPRPT
jgi:ribonuclease HI